MEGEENFNPDFARRYQEFKMNAEDRGNELLAELHKDNGFYLESVDFHETSVSVRYSRHQDMDDAHYTIEKFFGADRLRKYKISKLV